MKRIHNLTPRLTLSILLFLGFSSCLSIPATQKVEQMAELSETYTKLRSRIISIKPQEAGIDQSDAVPNIWGLLMEYQISNTPITLVTLSDGTTSLYLGNGGGFIGAGEHQEVSTVSMELIALAETYLSKMEPSSDLRLPTEGEVNFHFLTFDGNFTISIDEGELTKGRHDFSPLFYKANDVITQIRLLSSND